MRLTARPFVQRGRSTSKETEDKADLPLPRGRVRSMITHSASYRVATQRAAVEIPGGLRTELYRRPDGQTQCSWLPQGPDFKRQEVRAYVLSYYDSLVHEFEERFGSAGLIHGAAYEVSTKAGV